MKVKEQEYLAVFVPEASGGYTVTFPMLPGCVTCGETFEEAQAMAREALELWLEEVPLHANVAQSLAGNAILDRIAVRVPVQRRAVRRQSQTAKRYAAAHVA